MAIGTAQCCHLHYIKSIFQTIQQSSRKEDLKEGSKDEPLLTRMGSFRDRQKLFSNLSSEPQLQGVLRGKRLTSKSKPDNPKANQTRPVEKIQPSYLKSEPLGSTQQKNEKLHEKEVCTPKTDFNQVTLLQTDKKIDQSSLESEPLVSTQQENDKLHEKEVCTQKTDFDQVTLLQTDKKIDQSSLESEPIVSVQRDHTKMHGCQAHSVKTKTVCSAQDEGPLEANMTRTEEMNAKFGKKDPVGIEENETTEEDTVDIGTNVACLQTAERDEQINKLKADLNTSAHHQATLKKDHESKMAEQTLRIAKQESEIGKLSAELKATNATNQDQASKLKSFERMIVEKDQLIGSQKVDIENIKAALNASNQQHEETLSQYEQKIQEKEDSIVLKQSEVNKLNRDLKELKAANCVEMKEKDRKIIKELRKKERVIEELQQQMDNEIIENNRLNAESENIIADLNASNQQHKETLSQYKQKIQEKEDSIVLKQQQMDNERIENNRLNAESELEQYFFNINQSRHLFCLFLSFSHSNNNYSFCLINICKFKKRRWCA